MVFVKWLISLLWGGGETLSSITSALGKAYSDKLSAKTETDKIQAQANIDRLHAVLDDMNNARAAAKNYPWWMALLAFMIGFPFALHLFCVGLATTFQPLIVGGLFDWTLHIPKLPPPLDTSEVGIIAFFFGYAAVSTGLGAVAGAISQRKATPAPKG